LAGLAALSSSLPVKGDAAEKLLIKYLHDDDPRVRRSAMDAAAKLHTAKTGPEVAKTAAESVNTTTERAAAARALGLLGNADAATIRTLKDLSESKVGAAPVRAEALHALGMLDSHAAKTVASSLLDDENRGLQIEAIHVLGTTAEGARQAA